MVDVFELRVMLVMTRLLHGNERTITEQLRRNNLDVKSRSSLRRILKSLQVRGVLKHDLVAQEFVVDKDGLQGWREGLEVELKFCHGVMEQTKLLSHLDDHIIMGGSPFYSWVVIKEKKKVKN